MNKKQKQLISRMLSSWKFRLSMANRLPSVFFWGATIKVIDSKTCEVSLPFRWATQSPFKSTYFAAQCGAAELSTGMLSLLHLEGKVKSSMLVTQFESKFYKKVNETLRFVCNEGEQILETIEQAHKDGNGHELKVLSQGFLPNGDLACEFWVTWSYKKK